MWCQTYQNGQRYYREHKGSRSHGVCLAEGASMPCHVPDGQISKIVGAIELRPKWLEEAQAMLAVRRELLDGMRVLESRPERESELRQDWKDAAEAFLTELYSFREGIGSASGKYFDGQPVLFTDAARDLDKVIREAEELAGRFNSDFAKEADQGLQITLEALRPTPGKNIAQPVAFLVDLAKAEALYQLGEQPAAVELVEQYL